jgi:hypothetical protein
VTVSIGTNILVGHDFPRLVREARAIAGGREKAGRVPPLWDGHAGRRIAAHLLDDASVNPLRRTQLLWHTVRYLRPAQSGESPAAASAERRTTVLA